MILQEPVAMKHLTGPSWDSSLEWSIVNGQYMESLYSSFTNQ
jgi:hypothetical protein